MSIAPPRLVLDLRPCPGRVTTCELAIQIDGEAVWPVFGEEGARLEIQIDDLLAYLTEFWKPLILMQVYPIDVSPSKPSQLRQDAENRWEELPDETVAAEEEAVSNFEEAHDLAHAFAGIYGLPSFWLLRSGDRFLVETAGKLWRLPFEAVRDALSKAGEWICERLVSRADRKHWGAAEEAWHARDRGDAENLLAWSAGLAPELARNLIREKILDAPQDFDDAANDDDELRIAARMAGALPPEQIRGIITLARQFGPHDAEPLRKLSEACREHIAAGFESARPFVQGEAAARFVRERLRIPDGRPVDVFVIAKNLGIDIRHTDQEPATLDGLAIWGKRFGPGVFLNESSSRIRARGMSDIKKSRGARVTLAHELCHLLLDGAHAISALEILKARMPAGVEQRAKSFAGEFLLPTRIADQDWQGAGKPTDRAALGTLVDNLVDQYQVTHSVAAWKLEHAARGHDINLEVILDSLAPRR